MTVLLEQGDIEFWFRPSVQPAEALTYQLGVQSFFAVLSPAGGASHRRLRVGKKRMPAASRDRFWAKIERVGSLQRVLGDLLEPSVYSTKTRGERYQPAARPIARGTYAFVLHEDHVRFSYQLDERPDELVEDGPGVTDASHLVLFESPSGKSVWTTEGTPARLDTESEEIVLVGAQSPVEVG